MRTQFFLIGLSLALAACNMLWAGNPTRTNDIGVGIKTPAPSAAPLDRVVFACDGGKSFTATFDDAKQTVLIQPSNGAPVTLPIEVTGSGYGYANGQYELRGKGDEAMWTANGQPAITCKAQPK